jgi:hypothetical protein
MGMIGRVMDFLFGNGRNVVVETAEVFRINAEQQAQRAADARAQSLAQFAAEFQQPRKGVFDRIIDGLNRLPRPLLAFGTLGLFAAAMIDPIWFASRMQGIALVPEPLWWLMGAIVSFYFGARHQAKSQDFQDSVVRTASAVAGVVDRQKQLETPVAPVENNPALDAWRADNDR